MLLTSYRLEIFNNQCMPGAMTVNCFAHLDQDVSAALPYLNTVLGGFEYVQDPPAVTFKAHGKLITVHGRKIAVNALQDEGEARKIIDASGFDIRLEIDGGVKVNNIREIAEAGADTFVAGSAIFGTEDYHATVSAMRDELAKAQA